MLLDLLTRHSDEVCRGVAEVFSEIKIERIIAIVVNTGVHCFMRSNVLEQSITR